MKLICLQAGHEGRTSGATGAPGEQELNIRIRNRLADVLISKGFQIQKTNADPTVSEISKDFDLFLSIHGDANVYGIGGGFVDFPEPSTDGATAESQRIAKAIIEEYFKHSEIVNRPERSNVNTRFYYMWKKLSAKTPCVIIELGVVQDAHDKVLLNDTERITSALARGVCKAFGVAFDTPPTPQPQPSPVTDQSLYDFQGGIGIVELQRARGIMREYEGKINDQGNQINNLNSKISRAKDELG